LIIYDFGDIARMLNESSLAPTEGKILFWLPFWGQTKKIWNDGGNNLG
jgi:hypothetical protein